MPGSVVPAIVGVVLLFLVGALALLAEWRSTEARWFGVLNFCLALTTALGATSTSAPYGQAARALAFGKAANAAAGMALAALCLQLSALARATTHASVARLRRFAGPAGVVALAAGALAATPIVVGGERWTPGSGYVPTFGSGVWPLFAVVSALVAWAVAMVVALYRHGSARQRREVAWIAVGVLLFDLAGMVLLAMVLPRLGVPTVQWAPTSLAVGSIVMLGAMVLTRQHELEARDSQKSWSSARPRSRAHASAGEPSCRACATCGAMLTPSVTMAHCPLDGGEMREGSDPWLGRVIDERFRIDALLGAGGMGRVYRARHLRLDVPVAVKLLNADLAADRRMVERFAREARAAMRIRSAHAVTVHDFGEIPPGIPFLTMEIIEGGSLNVLLADGARLTAPSVALLGMQLARGLVAAHAEGVIHRDLKPDNVLVVRTGVGDVAKLVDFGLAKIVGEQLAGGELTTMGRVFGTPAYISPEQASGRPSDARSDVYALGVILFRARAGRKPFEGSALELLAAHIGEAPPSLGDEPLDRLISSLLAKDARQRPEARELIERFEPFTDGSRVLAVEGRAPAARTALDPTLPVTPEAKG